MSKSAPARPGWEFWIDRGGTFTDVIGRAPDGAESSAKLLSVSGAYADAAVEGMRRMLGAAPGAPFPADRVASIKLGTTVATNALLERKGAKTLLVTTRGFADALVIGDQTRPSLFALDIERPAPLFAGVVEADERLDAAGAVVRPLDEAALADGAGRRPPPRASRASPSPSCTRTSTRRTSGAPASWRGRRGSSSSRSAPTSRRCRASCRAPRPPWSTPT